MSKRALHLTFDVLNGGPPPRPGDILRPNKPCIAWYRVLGVEPIDSRVWHDRWRLRIERVEPWTAPAEGNSEIRMLRYKRGEGPRDHLEASA